VDIRHIDPPDKNKKCDLINSKLRQNCDKKAFVKFSIVTNDPDPDYSCGIPVSIYSELLLLIDRIDRINCHIHLCWSCYNKFFDKYICEHDRGIVRGYMACRTKDKKLQDEFANDSNDYIRYRAACNELNSPVTMAKFSKDKNKDVRSVVASHQKTPLRIVGKLRSDKCDNVVGIAEYWFQYRTCLKIASDQKSSHDDFIKIVRMRNNHSVESGMYCKALARNPSVTSDILSVLARDPDHVVRRLTARHPNTLMKDLNKLLYDKNSKTVRVEAQKAIEKRSFVLT